MFKLTVGVEGDMLDGTRQRKKSTIDRRKNLRRAAWPLRNRGHRASRSGFLKLTGAFRFLFGLREPDFLCDDPTEMNRTLVDQ